ncbi:MAG: M23 family metallopeptidase, partial [Rhizobiales bacterium]|nr:M23 family metallopeptidase [Hyphomicrobiales bacterium]
GLDDVGQRAAAVVAHGAQHHELRSRELRVGNVLLEECSVALIDTPQQVADNDDDDDDNNDNNGRNSRVRLYQSIYETALRQQVPQPLIDELIRIYSFDVDFQRRVQPGDSFELLYPGEDDPAGEGKNDILYASLTIGGETHRYYRFVTPDDNTVDYYDETGKSAKKFLVRKPVANAVMRSGYGWRRHPILGYSKLHTGVDWASPRGTPIFASGSGVIEHAGWQGGYGKYVRIRHNNGYETAYGHMSAIGRGISPGVSVRQGQIIGYVGSTGLSTGAHVHYEILVNGRFVDPMRIRLPRGRSLEGSLMASFDAQRKRVDDMMNRPANRMAEGTQPNIRAGGRPQTWPAFTKDKAFQIGLRASEVSTPGGTGSR